MVRTLIPPRGQEHPGCADGSDGMVQFHSQTLDETRIVAWEAVPVHAYPA